MCADLSAFYQRFKIHKLVEFLVEDLLFLLLLFFLGDIIFCLVLELFITCRSLLFVFVLCPFLF